MSVHGDDFDEDGGGGGLLERYGGIFMVICIAFVVALIVSKISTEAIFFGHLKSLHAQREERRKLGSSYNNPNRLNAEAERKATQARVLKRNKQFKEAHEMYTQAIELDRFNHEYFHHRAETAFNWGRFEWAIWDAQFGLELCEPAEKYKQDECFGLLWCTLVRSHMEMHQWEKAKQHCGYGLALIDKRMKFPLKVLTDYRSAIDEILQNRAQNNTVTDICMKPVHNSGDELMFMYSVKAASLELRDVAPLQPEILAVDLDKSMPTEKIFAYVLSEKLPEWKGVPDSLDDGDAFQVPGTKYWITPIPVRSKKNRSVLQSRLMCDCLKDTKIILVRVEESEGPPTAVDTATYLASVVKNAKNCEKMYGKGQKLTEG